MDAVVVRRRRGKPRVPNTSPMIGGAGGRSVSRLAWWSFVSAQKWSDGRQDSSCESF